MICSSRKGTWTPFAETDDRVTLTIIPEIASKGATFSSVGSVLSTCSMNVSIYAFAFNGTDEISSLPRGCAYLVPPQGARGAGGEPAALRLGVRVRCSVLKDGARDGLLLLLGQIDGMASTEPDVFP